jgi:hypothetical protein
MRYIDIGLTLCGLAILVLGANPAEALEPWPEFDAKSRRLRRRGRRRSTSARSLGASVVRRHRKRHPCADSTCAFIGWGKSRPRLTDR